MRAGARRSDLGLALAVADAVLYEGYLLYPYRGSSGKNRVRWQFEVLVPPAWGRAHGLTDDGVAGSAESWWQQTECLMEAPDAASVRIRLRFLQLQRRSVRHRAGVDAAGRAEFGVTVSVAPCRTSYHLLRLRVHVENTDRATPADGGRDDALRRCLLAVHTLVTVGPGRFHSLLDPPQWAAQAGRDCRNVHTFPVLAGPPGTSDIVLSSPIILYDHPRVAPESPGDLHDATEIDEILTLRTLTLAEREQREARATDPRAAAILDRAGACDRHGGGRAARRGRHRGPGRGGGGCMGWACRRRSSGPRCVGPPAAG